MARGGGVAYRGDAAEPKPCPPHPTLREVVPAESACLSNPRGAIGMDTYVKTVLTVIAACLLLQVAQGFGLAGTPGPGPTESSNRTAGTFSDICRA